MRPRRKDGAGADYDGHRQGMDVQADEPMFDDHGMDGPVDEPMFDDHGKGEGMDRDDPDQGLGAGTGAARSEPEYDMSGGLGMDGNAADAGDHAAEYGYGEHPASHPA
jgi:hypothetical protein